MAGKIKRMSQIKQLLIMYRQGVGKKTIARALNISKNTVKVYLDKVDISINSVDSKYTLDDLIALDDPVLESRLHAGNPAYKDDERYEQIMSSMVFYNQQLKKTGVNRHLLWAEYRNINPNGYSYSQFCWHIQQYQRAARPTAVLDHLPGDKLYVDYAGTKMSYIDINTGELIACQVFVACLPYSDFSFVMAVPSQTTEEFINALKCCLHQLGGVPKTIVPDNLKAAVIKSDKYEPDINQVLEDFANHYGTSVTPARIRKPQDKALVENQVKLIYTRVYAKLRNRQFFDSASLNEAIVEKVRDHNQTRMQKKPWSREEKFLGEEKNQLGPLPQETFEIKKYKEMKVAKNNHIYLSEDKNYYSVPYQLIGQKVKVIYTSKRVHIYAKGNQVAVHLRSLRTAFYSTDPSHLCSQHQHYRDRSPAYYINRAQQINNSFGQIVEELFKQNRYPEQLYRTCDGMIHLARHTNADIFEKVCQTALKHRVFT
jgi:transposase